MPLFAAADIEPHECPPVASNRNCRPATGGTASAAPDPGSRWLKHFRNNRLRRPEPDWNAPVTLPPHKIAKLVRSLEQFQLGDGGGPASLIAWNAESFRSSTPENRELVDLWFAEEKEHSRLLGGAVKRFGGTPITGHWSFAVFLMVRRWLGVRFELTVLLLTEIVSTVYYRLLRRHGEDPALRAMCRLILRDEAGHVSFHRARLARRGAGAFGAWYGSLFRVLGFAAGTMLWINHAPALKALGATTPEFYSEAAKELSLFLARLRREAVAGSVGVCNPRVPRPDSLSLSR